MSLDEHVGRPASSTNLAWARAAVYSGNGTGRALELTGAPHKVDADSLPAILEYLARKAPQGPALVAPGRQALSFAGLHTQVEETAATLRRLGIGRGDSVALILPPGAETASAFLGVAAAASAAPLNPSYRRQEFALHLDDLRARAVVIAAGEGAEARAAAAITHVPVLDLHPLPGGPAGRFELRGGPVGEPREREDCAPDDIALLLHTSGTTARPKLVPLTHANLCASARNIGRALALTSADRSLVVMPLFHSHGLLGGLLAALTAGGAAACVPGLDVAKFFDWMRELRPTYITAAPTIFQAVLAWAEQHPDAATTGGSLRLLRTASSALPTPVLHRLENLLGVPVIETYGLTETATQVTSNPLPPGLRKAGSVGKPAGPEVQVVDEQGAPLASGAVGEVVVRGPTVSAGYVDDPAANAAGFREGWLRTGDQGYFDADGYLFLTGRIKEIINRAGEKIAPREVEEVLLQHPDVVEAAVFGVPHELLGESVAAAVVTRCAEGSVACAAEADLRRFVGQRLSEFKVPARILVVDAIPKSATGKVQRALLRDQIPVPLSAATEACGGVPRSESDLEDRLAEIWRQVLGVASIGRHDDFFEVGGDSVLAASLLVEIERQLGPRLLPETLYQAKTIKDLTALLRNQPGGSTPGQKATVVRAGEGGTPIFLVPPAGDNALVFRDLVSALEPQQTIYCLPGVPAAVRTAAQEVVEAAVAGYVRLVLDVQPTGPYQLCGFSYGGTLAVELGRQLRAAGAEVAFVGLIDSRCPGYARPTSVPQKLQKHWRALGRLRGRKKLQYLADYLRTLLRWPPRHPPEQNCGGRTCSTTPSVGSAADLGTVVYRPKHYPGHLIVFRALEQEIVHHAQRQMGWEFVAREVQVVDVPGGHYTVVKEPNSRVLAAAVGRFLEKPQPQRDL
jgi:acyl-CoA synthetase (AMP-forming)/AMP-acid ligase II/thioesterase domain-containing protein/acyl carrier protein